MEKASPTKVYWEFVRNRETPYYRWIQIIGENMEGFQKTGQKYIVINPRSLVKEIEKKEPHKKLTHRNLSLALRATLSNSKLKEGWGKDFFTSGITNGGVIYHVKVSSAIPVLKSI